MNTINLAQERKKAIEFEPISVEGIDEEKLGEALDGAERALHKYRKMLECLTKADELTDGVELGTWLHDFMTEECSVPVYEDSAMDIVHGLKKHLTVQIARFKQFCDDLEAEIEDSEEQRRNDEKYGSYEDQVRWTYRNSVL